MFEVEKKFTLSEEQKINLLDGAEFVSEKTFTDIYYDTSAFNLTKEDIWLRARGSEFELKVPAGKIGDNWLTQKYHEIVGEEMIRGVFAVPRFRTFAEDIGEHGYFPFCTCATTRKKYAKDGFTIDLDEVEYGDFAYAVAEIELLVEEKSQTEEAAEKIEKFALKNGLEIKSVRGKVIEYLLRKKPEHYQTLVEAGVVKSDI